MALSTTRRRTIGSATAITALLLICSTQVVAQPETADLTIVKESNPKNTPFPFFLVSPTNDTTFFTLTDPSDADTTFLELAPGTYEIWETLPKFWALSVVSGGIGINTPNDSLAGTTAILNAEDSLTVTIINTGFFFDIQKTDSLFYDLGTPDVADAGDSLLYRIRIIETVGPIGNLVAASFELTDTPDANTTLAVGSVQVDASSGSPNIILGNGVGHTSVWVESAVHVGDTTTVWFKVGVNDEPDATDFCNQAFIKGRSTTRNTPIIPSDDPDDATSSSDETCVAAAAPSLPVELTSFESRVVDGDVVLTWTTASESNNAGFAVQMKRHDQVSFIEKAFVEGRGTTLESKTYRYDVIDLEPGRYDFRLNQIDLDGVSHYSPTVQASIEVAGSFFLSDAYPNPFNPTTNIRLGVGSDQPVQVTVFDALGKQVALLYDGQIDKGDVVQIRFEAENLPSGLYFIRAAGRSFTATKTVTLLR